MPLERQHEEKIFVFVLESPSHEDFYSSRGEGSIIEKAVALNQIPCSVRVITSIETFSKALTEGLYEEKLKYPERVIVLHMSMHGNSEGIVLTDGTTLPWHNLREYLKPINRAYSGNLLLCMSSCEGYGASRMSMYTDDVEYPYFAVVGNSGKPTWSETAVGYAAFYHYIACGQTVVTAVNAMREASGNKEFYCSSAQELHDRYVEFVKNYNSGNEVGLSTIEEKMDQETPGLAAEVKSNIDK